MISQSVGKGGVNQPADVMTVKGLLAEFLRKNNRPPLSNLPQVDGTMERAIFKFQQLEMKVNAPDGRVDPHGRTIRALQSYATPAAPAGSLAAVTYGKDVALRDQLVSDYAVAVIRKAVTMAGMKAAVMTSTLRRPAEQAAIMYRNARVNLAGQFKLYGNNGDEVLKVYKDNQSKPERETVALMQKKIEDLLLMGRQVSRHVTTPQLYASLNVVDIGVNSTRLAAGTTFDLGALTAAFAKLKQQGFIREFIDETKKSNTCWHVEIVPNAKPL